jgi:folate-binding protein YgfZ
MSELSSTSTSPADLLEQTPLTAHLLAQSPALPIAPYCGAQTIESFAGSGPELAALTGRAGVYDLGYRAFVRITGSDRVRWLNGMVTNTIVALDEGKGNYSFLLNAQGRIQGDANIYHFSDHLLLETDRSQLAALVAHLDHFIIMDDVELQPLDASTTAIGVAGPAATQILSQLQLAIPQENASAPSTGQSATGQSATWQSAALDVTHIHSPLVPRFELRLPAAGAPALWAALIDSGAVPSGSAAVEALRILEGTPLYAVDIRDRHLAQETGQNRALNFNKGCYLGQEIVERIRSRATVHRNLRQFSLAKTPARLQAGQTLPLEAEGAPNNPVGELSSVAEYDLPGFSGTLALGFIRTEVLERKLPVTCGGTAVTALDAPPKIADRN